MLPYREARPAEPHELSPTSQVTSLEAPTTTEASVDNETSSESQPVTVPELGVIEDLGGVRTSASTLAIPAEIHHSQTGSSRKRRQPTMLVRRLSVSSNPETRDGADLTTVDSSRHSSFDFSIESDDEDPFGLNSRRRSSLPYLLRRNSEPVSFPPYLFRASSSNLDDNDSVTWSARVTRSNSFEEPFSVFECYDITAEDFAEQLARHGRIILIDNTFGTPRRRRSSAPSSWRLSRAGTDEGPSRVPTRLSFSAVGGRVDSFSSWLDRYEHPDSVPELIFTGRGAYEVIWASEDETEEDEDHLQYEGQPAASSYFNRSETGYGRAALEPPSISLFPRPSTHPEVTFKESDDDEPKHEDEALDPDQAPGSSQATQRFSRRSYSCAEEDPFVQGSAAEQEPPNYSLSVPSTPLLDRQFSNLPPSTMRFRTHRDSVDLSHIRMMRLGRMSNLVARMDAMAVAKQCNNR